MRTKMFEGAVIIGSGKVSKKSSLLYYNHHANKMQGNHRGNSQWFCKMRMGRLIKLCLFPAKNDD